MKRGISIGRELVFGVLALLAALPIWAVSYPPIRDLPQHLATIRVLHDYAKPELAFSQFFVTTLGSTQYLGYYLVTHLLAFPLGVGVANKLVLTFAICGLPYATRRLLRALGRDEALALFTLPLVWNGHLMLGFLNFIAAIPLAIWGIALAVRQHDSLSRKRALLLSVVALVTFYMHVVPFAFLGLGTVLVAYGHGLKGMLERWLALVPALFASLFWAYSSPAGNAVRASVGLTRAAPGVHPDFTPWSEAMRLAPNWLLDVFQDDLDDRLFIVWAALVLVCVAQAVGARLGDSSPTEDAVRRGRLARRVAWLSPLAVLGYFVLPSAYAWIWPINTRFPLLALIFLVPVLPAPRGFVRPLVYAGLICVSVISSNHVLSVFRAFERHEVGELDAALGAIPQGQKVAGLIWDRGSRYVKFSPFVHAAAWYQAQKGGAVVFTFADFPHSPIRFRESNRPPRLASRWEWMPEKVDPVSDLAWFDYVLTRGGPGRIAEQPRVFARIFQGSHWSVFKRIGR